MAKKKKPTNPNAPIFKRVLGLFFADLQPNARSQAVKSVPDFLSDDQFFSLIELVKSSGSGAVVPFLVLVNSIIESQFVEESE